MCTVSNICCFSYCVRTTLEIFQFFYCRRITGGLLFSNLRRPTPRFISMDENHTSDDGSDEEYVPSEGELRSEDDSSDCNDDLAISPPKKKRKLNITKLLCQREDPKPEKCIKGNRTKDKSNELWAELTKDCGPKHKICPVEGPSRVKKELGTILTPGKQAKNEKNAIGPKRGISSVLSDIRGKGKLSTLEKSKLDWESFKEEEGIKEDLAVYNRGKNGYLERQDFLRRADLRQFEVEKNMRAKKRDS